MRYTALLATLAAVSLHSTAVRAQAIQWGPAPPNLPAGAKLAVLQGDPSKDGLFTIRLDMPDGYKIPPHFHPTDENVTVVEGTFLVGMGDKLDPAQTTALPAGGFVTAGAGQHHFGIAKGHTVVQVHAMGPFALTYVNPADDPTMKKTP